MGRTFSSVWSEYMSCSDFKKIQENILNVIGVLQMLGVQFDLH